MGSNRGQSLISVVVGIVAITAGMIYFLYRIPLARKTSQELNQKLIAQAFAIELLEMFRAFRDDHLLEYLRFNPVDYQGCSTAGGGPTCNENQLYKFCSHINILDRTTGNIMNKDPIADLPPNTLDIPQGDPILKERYRSNRYYEVQIVDTSPAASPGTLSKLDATCGCSPRQVALSLGTIAANYLNFTVPAGNACPNTSPPLVVVGAEAAVLSPTQKFLITVSVTWVPKSKTPSEAVKVTSSTLIPDNHL